MNKKLIILLFILLHGNLFVVLIKKNRADQKRAAQVKVKGWHNENVTQDEADAICIGKYLTEKYLRNF